jgi:hypothetical protein
VVLERGPLSHVSKIKELLGRNSSGLGLEIREYGRGDPLHWPHDTLYTQRLPPTSRSRSVCILRSLTKTTEFVVCLLFICLFTYSFHLRHPPSVSLSRLLIKPERLEVRSSMTAVVYLTTCCCIP